MTDWYNLTAVNASNMLSLTQSINDVFMFHQWGNLLLLVIFIILFSSFMLFNNNPKVNFMFAFFAVMILSMMLRFLDLVPDSIPFLCTGIFAVALMVAIIKSE